jgi:hypothetical protein
MFTNLDIINFIEGDRREKKSDTSISCNPVYYYTHGGCYKYALYLKNKFGGEIYYLTLENHFVLLYNGYMYDITGNVTKLYSCSKRIPECKLSEKFLSKFER